MPTLRPVIAVFLLITGLAACERNSGSPEFSATMNAGSANTAWPQFLPIKQILHGELSDFELTESAINSMRYRIARLRAKAAILQDPTLTEDQKVKKLARLLRRTG